MVNLKWYDYLIIGAFILFLILLVWKLVGDSPTETQMIWVALFAFGGIAIKNYRDVGEIKVGMQHSFNKVKEDFEKVNVKLDSLLKKKVK